MLILISELRGERDSIAPDMQSNAFSGDASQKKLVLLFMRYD